MTHIVMGTSSARPSFARVAAFVFSPMCHKGKPMAIEIVFGAGLGDLRFAAEQTILAHRRAIDLPEDSFESFAAGLNELLYGMARDCADYVLAPDGARFYLLLLVKKPTLGLDFNQSVTFTDRKRV